MIKLKQLWEEIRSTRKEIRTPYFIRLNDKKHYLFLLKSKDRLTLDNYDRLNQHGKHLLEKLESQKMSLFILDGGIELQIIEK